MPASMPASTPASMPAMTTYLLAFLCCFFYLQGFAQPTESEPTAKVDTVSKSSNSSSNRRTPTQIALEEAKKAVVNIEGDRVEKSDSNNPNEIGKAFNGMGTGVLIDPRGYIVTNHHVIDGIQNIKVSTNDNKKYKGIPIAKDPVTDIAIIKINDSKPFSTIKIGCSADIIWGEVAYAIGNPYGYPFTVTNGLVSGLERDVLVNDNGLTYASAIQTCVPINPGNSGGPLLNADGEMIGMNAAIRSGTQGIAFAIPVDQVVEVAARLIQQETARLTYHGIRLKPSSNSEEIFVESVEPESPAEKAGIQPNDRLLAANEIEFHRSLDFSRSLLELKNNETLMLSFQRDGEKYETTVQLAAAKRKSGQGSSVASRNTTNPTGRPQQPSIVSPGPKVGKEMKESDLGAWNYLGIKFSAIPENVYKQQYSKYLDDYPDGAIRITEVRRDSPMFLCGVEAEDIIFGINGLVSSTEDDVNLIIADLQKNRSKTKSVAVLLNRPKPYDGEPADGHFSTMMELP